MAAITYYVVLPFILSEDGESFPGEPQEAPNGSAAVAKAKRFVETSGGGAIAFYRSGDPAMGEFDDATVLASFGKVPADALCPGPD